MIYTRFGTPIKRVLWYDHFDSFLGCFADYPADLTTPDVILEKLREFHVSDLKADGGIAEIDAACRAEGVEQRNADPEGTEADPLCRTKPVQPGPRVPVKVRKMPRR
jgi:hypothetical protein